MIYCSGQITRRSVAGLYQSGISVFPGPAMLQGNNRTSYQYSPELIMCPIKVTSRSSLFHGFMNLFGVMSSGGNKIIGTAIYCAIYPRCIPRMNIRCKHIIKLVRRSWTSKNTTNVTEYSIQCKSKDVIIGEVTSPTISNADRNLSHTNLSPEPRVKMGQNIFQID